MRVPVFRTGVVSRIIVPPFGILRVFIPLFRLAANLRASDLAENVSPSEAAMPQKG